MIKIISKFIVFLFFSLLLITFLLNPEIVIRSVNYSVNVFISNILPTLFPFFILADALINYGYIDYLESFFKFKYSSIILMSMVSGLPSNAKYIGEFLRNNLISKRDAEIILSVTFFPNPMFVIGSVGSLMLENVKLGFLILINIYLSNLILFLIYYRKLDGTGKSVCIKREPFSSFIKSSILKNFSTLMIILGTVVIFVTISNVIFNYIDMGPIFEGCLQSFLEMTSGVKKMSELNIGVHLKVILITFSLIFSGLSIMVQALSMISEYDVNVKFIFKNKLLLLLISLIINYIYIVVFIWWHLYFNYC